MKTDILFSNNATTRTTQVFTPQDTELFVTLGSTSKYPTVAGEGQYFMLCILDNSGNYEILKCTGSTTNSFIVERAQEGTTAKYFAVDSTVENRLTAGSLYELLNTTIATQQEPGLVRVATPEELAAGESADGVPAALTVDHMENIKNAMPSIPIATEATESNAGELGIVRLAAFTDFTSSDKAATPKGVVSILAAILGNTQHGDETFTSTGTWRPSVTALYSISCCGGGGGGARWSIANTTQVQVGDRGYNSQTASQTYLLTPDDVVTFTVGAGGTGFKGSQGYGTDGGGTTVSINGTVVLDTAGGAGARTGGLIYTANTGSATSYPVTVTSSQVFVWMANLSNIWQSVYGPRSFDIAGIQGTRTYFAPYQYKSASYNGGLSPYGVGGRGGTVTLQGENGTSGVVKITW